MNACSRFYGNLSSGCQDISLQSTNFNLVKVLEIKSVGHQPQYDSSSGNHDYLNKVYANQSCRYWEASLDKRDHASLVLPLISEFMAIHPIFQSRLKWWTKLVTDWLVLLVLNVVCFLQCRYVQYILHGCYSVLNILLLHVGKLIFYHML